MAVKHAQNAQTWGPVRELLQARKACKDEMLLREASKRLEEAQTNLTFATPTPEESMQLQQTLFWAELAKSFQSMRADWDEILTGSRAIVQQLLEKQSIEFNDKAASWRCAHLISFDHICVILNNDEL